MNLTENRIITLERNYSLLSAQAWSVQQSLAALSSQANQAEIYLYRSIGISVGTGLGFDLTSDYNFGVLDPTWFAAWPTVLYSVAEHVEDYLPQISVLVAGNQPDECGQSIYFAEGDWETIGDWINDGGRLWLNGEWLPTCQTDQATFNAFLEAIGSTIQSVAGSIDNDSCGSGGKAQTPGAIPLSANSFYCWDTSYFSGGTPVFYDSTGVHCTMAIEALGDGYVCVYGDSNTFACPTGSGLDPNNYTNMALIEMFSNPGATLI